MGTFVKIGVIAIFTILFIVFLVKCISGAPGALAGRIAHGSIENQSIEHRSDRPEVVNQVRGQLARMLCGARELGGQVVPGTVHDAWVRAGGSSRTTERAGSTDGSSSAMSASMTSSYCHAGQR